MGRRGRRAIDRTVTNQQEDEPVKYLFLVTIVGPIITAYIKSLLPQIPKKYIPLISPALGGLAEGAIRLSVGTDLPEGFGVAAGAAGVAVREVVDQWRKEGVDGSSTFGLALCLLLAGTGLGGCSSARPFDPNAPLPPPLTEAQIQQQREKRCNWAETLATGAKLGALYAVAETNDEDVRKALAASLGAVDAGIADYCDTVRAGGTPDAEQAALAAVRDAIDTLTRMLLDDLEDRAEP
jgi:hypothetical protein